MSRINIVKTLAIIIVLAISNHSFAGPDVSVEEYTKAVTLQPDLENGQEVYMVCAPCHLQQGWGLQDGTFPQIAGQHRSVLIQQLSDIHKKNRDNPTMYPFALPEAIGDAQDIADVAGYIETMKMTPDNGKGEWAAGSSEFEGGKKQYVDYCASCHGNNGEGDPSKLYPKIQGQHYKYLLRQLEWMRVGKRRSVKHDMLQKISSFTQAEIAHVANYVSRLAVPEKDLAP